MAVPDQLTGQKLEENPLLPTDNQKDLTYTLTRIFRVLAQIVNPLVAWAAKWKGITPGGAAWGNVLIIKAIPPDTGKGAALILQAAAPDGAAIVAGDRPANTRLWNIVMPTQDATGDFAIERLPDGAAGINAVKINRATGAMDVFGRLGTNNDIASSNGGLSVTKNITGASGMGLMWDGGQANYLCMGAGVAAPWSWQWNRSNGTLNWLGDGAGLLYSIDGSGNSTTAGQIKTNAGGDAISAPNGNIATNQMVFAGAAGVRTIGPVNADGQVSGSTFWVKGAHAISINTYQDDGSGYAYQNWMIGNPNWNGCYMRSWHQYGAWAGWQLWSANDNTIQIVMSNGGGWGSIRAASFDVQSDTASKREVRAMPSALDVLNGIQAHTYEFIPPKERKKSEPIYGKTRYCGTLAQDWLERLPEAVTEAVMEDGSKTLMLDYAAIGAVTAQAASELLARVNTLEARIAALEAA
jgi:hypothetical protein